MNKIFNSPIEKKLFEQQTIYIKRDDLLDNNFSGNKARKFYYYLVNDFPNIKKIVSYGSNQSNAMYSLSVLAKIKGWEFEYFVSHVPLYLEENPHGNFKHALENGMDIHVGQGVPTPTMKKHTLFIEEGGRQQEAEYGIELLAKEIVEWQEDKGLEELNVFLPAGTGTTALFLSKAFLQKEFFGMRTTRPTVFTVPCVGDVDYLKKQFLMLEEDENVHPFIITPSKKRHFGKLYRESYNIWLKLQAEMGIEFDLLYDPHGWLTLLENPELFDKPLLYIHQGGLMGNESMLMRYKRKYSENI
ncbi:1-aminocyclopropane-1-carboxylate deaminase/D-cysteine desulfhydrase [bacterium]|nr:1-aminocyclopropane-1-carboxylate deaminase/D-cysteine desulfhydrase [bacterium]MBU1956965.1 1-aminocyclopropane-1-carboxylate deaminase/D-cysteine desulfhydrase [bacterium]